MFSFFKRKKKTSEISEKPVEPVLDTRQPETLEEGAALSPVPEHSIPSEPPLADDDRSDMPDGASPEPVIPDEPPVKEPPSREPPAKEPPGPNEPPPQEPPSREPPVREPPVQDPATGSGADAQAASQAAPAVAGSTAPAVGSGAGRQVQSLPEAAPVHVDLTDKAAAVKKSADEILSHADERTAPASSAGAAASGSGVAPAAKPATPAASDTPRNAGQQDSPASNGGLAPPSVAAGSSSSASETDVDSAAAKPAATVSAAPLSASPSAESATPATSAPAQPSAATPEAATPEAATSTPATNATETPVTATPPASVAGPSATAERPKSEKRSWLTRLKDGLSRTGSNISSLFVGVKVDENLFEELETALIMADAGVEATETLLGKLRNKVKKERIEDAQTVKHALRDLLTEHLTPLEKQFHAGKDQTRVVMIAGVNGAGKTTSIGKLAHHFQAQGHSVLLAAGDTFRAAAREQLIEWGSRNNVAVIAQDGGDPAAVAFDAVNAGRARKASIVMVDTAGRLPTQLHLMEELKKIKRVIGKADGDAPHEVLLVVDGNTGQNAISQIKAFDAALTLTGLVVTKLDGTAKGGTLAAVAAGSQGVRPVPVYWIGVGESLQDLQPFVAAEFAGALLGD